MDYLNNNLKSAINMLQFHIDRSSNNILLIFDNVEQQMRYIRSLKEVVINEIGITINQLYMPNILDGKRYKQYYFISDDDILDKNSGDS